MPSVYWWLWMLYLPSTPDPCIQQATQRQIRVINTSDSAHEITESPLFLSHQHCPSHNLPNLTKWKINLFHLFRPKSLVTPDSSFSLFIAGLPASSRDSSCKVYSELCFLTIFHTRTRIRSSTKIAQGLPILWGVNHLFYLQRSDKIYP